MSPTEQINPFPEVRDSVNVTCTYMLYVAMLTRQFYQPFDGFSERNVHTCRNQIPKSGPLYSEVPRLRSRLEIFLLTARPVGLEGFSSLSRLKIRESF